MRRLPDYRLSAVASLAQAPAPARPELLRSLGKEDDFVARRLEAELRARWGDPAGGLDALIAALPDDRESSLEPLRGLIDQLRTQQTSEGRRTLARGLEALADRSADSDRARLRLDAARAYTAAGDRNAARRMLAGLAEDRSAPAPVAAGATSALVQVLIGEGRPDEAARRLAEAGPSLSYDERASLRLRLVGAWLKEGNLARADSALGSDSTVEALAIAGRVHLFQGDIAGAVERLRKAGRTPAIARRQPAGPSLLALLQPIEADSLPSLGRAMLQLEQGDTSKAVAGLTEVAQDLPAAGGGAEISFLPGRLAAQAGNASDAERLFRAAAVKDAPGTAPAAELALGELLLAQGRSSDAVSQLEHLILTYPESALVPQARRRLDQARGAVPKT